MNSFYVYQLRLENSELPFYIGKGKGRRTTYHFTPSGLKAKSMKNAIIRKAARESVKVIVEFLHVGMSERAALDKEVELIALHGRRDNGTGILANHTDGGDGASGSVKSEEAREKIASAKRGIKRSPETVKKMSDANRGKMISGETRDKISSFQRGRKKTPEHLQSMKFGQLDKNPAWKIADVIYDTWVDTGKPGWVNLQKSFSINVRKLQEKFSNGWNPRNDEEWKIYASRDCRMNSS